MQTAQKPVHENKPYNATKAADNVVRDQRAKDATSAFLISRGFTIVDNQERFAKYDLAVSKSDAVTLKIECEDRLIRDWRNMIKRSFDTFRIYKRKINPEAEWHLYVASCQDDPDRILVTTYNDISNSPTQMITNVAWGRPEPVYEVDTSKWVCYNTKTGKIEWGNNPVVMITLEK
jgi:hypothetical protein